MKILFLESFFGGSHRDVAQGFAERSRHKVDILSLPARFWKWRMRGAALYFVRQISNISAYDLVLATDLIDLTDFKALAGQGCPPVVLYFHENQLSYPLAPGEKRDFHLGFTNIVSALAADRVVFNSKFHQADFFAAARRLIRKMPDARPAWMIDRIENKSSVLYPGCKFPLNMPDAGRSDMNPPLVVWNHRWEYDKNPDAFFRVLGNVKKRGINFSLAVLGEQYDAAPPVFDRIRQEFNRELLVFGFVESRSRYLDYLCRGTVAISTADQENFGLAMIEAAACGCIPLLPKRLSYPELVPRALNKKVLYSSETELEMRLAQVLSDPGSTLADRRVMMAHAGRFAWQNMIHVWDEFLQTSAAG